MAEWASFQFSQQLFENIRIFAAFPLSPDVVAHIIVHIHMVVVTEFVFDCWIFCAFNSGKSLWESQSELVREAVKSQLLSKRREKEHGQFMNFDGTKHPW